MREQANAWSCPIICKYFSTFLTGSARNWFTAIAQPKLTLSTTWPEYKNMFVRYFIGLEEQQSVREELRRCLQRGRKQTSVAQSTCEAELIAANEVTKELMWVRNFLEGLRIAFNKPLLLVDNKSTIKIIKNSDIKRRSKHIEIKHSYVRDLVKKRELINVEYIDTDNQQADFLTKSLAGPKLATLLESSKIL